MIIFQIQNSKLNQYLQKTASEKQKEKKKNEINK